MCMYLCVWIEMFHCGCALAYSTILQLRIFSLESRPGRMASLGQIAMQRPQPAQASWSIWHFLSAIRGPLWAQSIGNEAAPLLAAQYGAEIQFDTQSQTPYFTYLDEAGQPHEVWFEDARSAQAKFALLPEYGLLGLGYWNFMRPFTAGFSLQNYLFTASGLR